MITVKTIYPEHREFTINQILTKHNDLVENGVLENKTGNIYQAVFDIESVGVATFVHPLAI